MDLQWQGSVDIAAPVDRVYAYLADFPRHCEWAQTIESMELIKPGSADGIGAVYKTYERQAFQSDRAPKGPMPEKASKATTECEVTELKPNSRIAWKAKLTPKSMGVNAKLSFELSANDDGGTHLTQHILLHQPWVVAKIVSPLMFRTKSDEMQSKGRAQWQASLDNIKRILEEPER